MKLERNGEDFVEGGGEAGDDDEVVWRGGRRNDVVV